MATIEERITSGGTKSYRAKVRLKGRPSASATFSKRSNAREWARSTESAIKEGRYFKTAEAKRHTLADLIDRYLAEIMVDKPKSMKDQTHQLNWWKAQLGDYVLADITTPLLIETRSKLRQETIKKGKHKTKRSNATINRYCAAISHALSIAVREWEWLESNAMKKIKRLKEDRGRDRYLNEKEIERLLTACDEYENDALYLIVILALSTGARQGEILNLHWNNVDLKRRLITFVETKNGEIRSVPLEGRAYELIKQRSKTRRIDTKLIFPSNNNPNKPLSIHSIFKRAVAKGKIKDFRFHDLRHSCASYLTMNGASITVVAEILGHKTLAMVKRYSHLSQEHKSDVVAAMNNKLFGNVKTPNNNSDKLKILEDLWSELDTREEKFSTIDPEKPLVDIFEPEFMNYLIVDLKLQNLKSDIDANSLLWHLNEAGHDIQSQARGLLYLVE